MGSETGATNQGGSALLAVVVVGALCAIALTGLSIVARDALDATRAQTVADAGALAGTTGGPRAVARVVRAGGGIVVSASSAQTDYDVVVRVGRATAAARARRDPPSVGAGTRAGLAPAMLGALARADELLGTEVPLVSGFRTAASQQALWDGRDENPYPVARPGTSRHERGLAIDVPLAAVSALAGVAPLAGLCHPLPESDPVHFIVCPTDR